jgi:hypothetical protein
MTAIGQFLTVAVTAWMNASDWLPSVGLGKPMSAPAHTCRSTLDAAIDSLTQEPAVHPQC